MSLDDAFRLVVRDELRAVIREEVRAALADARSTAPADDGYLSVEKAAGFVEVHPDTIRGWVKAGRLPEHRAGRELRIRRDELHRFLDGAQGSAHRPTPDEVALEILSRRRK